MATLMVQGTGSHVGKSILVAALCRIFRQDGVNVAPFKAQNMALNSFVTSDGLEMGRAQVVQAEAAMLAPHIDMNPVLLKPTADISSQVVLMGKPLANVAADEYHRHKTLALWPYVTAALDRLQRDYELIVIEGAGSPAEVNLHDSDIVNMRVARHLHAPVLLVADIDKGGALASLVGTLELLTPEERDLVKGFIINKFRGNVSLLQPALDFLQAKTGKPVVGVVPHLGDLGLDEEDTIAADRVGSADAAVNIAVIRHRHISNFTDCDALAAEPDVALRYVTEPGELAAADLILLPGSKNTIDDLQRHRDCGLAAAIVEAARSVPVIGICGGLQMLGERIDDPEHTEATRESIAGLGLLPVTTTFAAQKRTAQVAADCRDWHFLDAVISARNLRGYEIHMGATTLIGSATDLGCGWARANVMGTYLHGIFDHDDFRRDVLNAVRARKGLAPLPSTRNLRDQKQAAYDRLAAVVRKALDLDYLRRLLALAD